MFDVLLYRHHKGSEVILAKILTALQQIYTPGMKLKFITNIISYTRSYDNVSNHTPLKNYVKTKFII